MNFNENAEMDSLKKINHPIFGMLEHLDKRTESRFSENNNPSFLTPIEGRRPSFPKKKNENKQEMFNFI